MLESLRRPGLLLTVALACLVAGFASLAALAEETPVPGDLAVIPAPDGSMGLWLQEGPSAKLITAEIPTSAREGEKALGSAWTALASPKDSVRIKFEKAGRAYLAVVLRAEEARTLYLATGSDAGLAAFLGGREILRREEGRRARPDTDLTRLDLAAGDNLLVLALDKSKRGPGTVYARLLDEGFEAPQAVEILLPGAARRGEELLAAAARARFERDVDLAAGLTRVRLALDFPGGRPVLPDTSASISFQGPGAPQKAEAVVPLDPKAREIAILGSYEFGTGPTPTAVNVAFAGSRQKVRLGLNATAVRDAAEARRLLDGAPQGDVRARLGRETAEFLVDEVVSLVEQGDEDTRYVSAEATRALRYAREIAEGRDPLSSLRGKAERLGYRSSIDGATHPFGLYVPPAWREDGDRRFGLVVALHGLNSYPMKTLTSLFGVPLGENESKLERERRPLPVGSAPMFAVAPEGFGNSNYFGYGERDVLEVVARVAERYRIDPDRVYVTGASMGGTGAAAVPLHFPDRFAAAAPLCGYHSVFEYNAVRGKRLEPWEKSAAARLSNVSYAENGRYLPLHIVHGTLDQPRTSEVLVRRYQSLGYDVAFETPVSHHNVWDETYAKRWIFDHFRPLVRADHPRRVAFATGRLRYAGAHWVRIEDLVDYGGFARIDATWRSDGVIAAKTENARAVAFLADEVLAAKGNPSFEIDGEAFAAFAPEGRAWRFHRNGGRWVPGFEACPGLCKREGLSGPIDDAWYEPLLFVYGTADPKETALSRRLAEALSVPRAGVTVRYPVRADVDVTAEDIANRSLVLVGTPRGNSLLAKIQGSLRVRAVDGAIEAGGTRFEGARVAAVCVHPNPLNPSRYVLVHTGASREAIFYADHLPELLPDWIVYDASSWQTKGGTILDGRAALAAGFFDRDWKIAE